ncbi:hypothetical protein BD626DRAFT_491622 [Schizophyllum amplum]|uniref:DnaJ-domain-containing protein n=1 Tax=Schizophyllum amplum TaxID=97359 RepID=A0A550CHZ9_9AGAR|nr:hypothetical protein BD626DRAFT_491622 [Auriculariopsis ampla]
MLSSVWVLLWACALAWAADLYKVLDVHPSASERDIRYAYKKLSKKWHPDKNKQEGAEERFIEIAHAYEVLSDTEKRAIYDRHGEEGLKAHESGANQHNPFDMFSNFFGGGHPQQQQTRRGPSSITEFEVTLADMYTGNSIDFRVKKKILCDHCRGTGAASDRDIHKCDACGGGGVRIVKQQIFPGMFAQQQVTCDACGGRGHVVKRACPHCGGRKILDHTAHLTLDVEPGMREGHEVLFEGEADESPDYEAGDVILRVRSRKETGGWRRKEGSLYWREALGVDEALLGFERNLTHLDGHVVTLRREGVTQPGHVQTLKGEGMPLPGSHGSHWSPTDTHEDCHPSTHGDLYVEYAVVLPAVVEGGMRKKLEEAFDAPAAHDEL